MVLYEKFFILIDFWYFQQGVPNTEPSILINFWYFECLYCKENEVLADPWPVFEGYVERKFQDEATSDKEADAYIAELKRDFARDEE